MRPWKLAVVVATLALACPSFAQTTGGPTTAIEDAGRPEADRIRDELRKPAAMLAFAEIKPGQIVGELLPGGGYFTRLFSVSVGAEGRVYGIISPANPERPTPAIRALAANPAYANVVVIEGPLPQFTAPEPLDLVWTSQNYHDIPDEARPAVNAAVFAALKPGGLYVVLDHSAIRGSGPVNTLHRMDETVVRDQVLAAGFQFVSDTDVLRNPGDNRAVAVFDADTRGHTDQFVLKFRKPA